VTDRSSSRSRVIALLAVAAVVGVVLSLVGGYLLINESSGDTSGDSDRNQVTARANDFAVAYNTYDVVDLADYQKRLKGLLTPDYNKQFVGVTDAVFKALEQKKQKSGGAKVLGVAVDSIDEDSAVAIVAVDAKISNTDTDAEVLRHFRWKLSFTKTKDEWLISNFESVAAVDAEATPAPSASTGEPEAGEGQ
jgi:Mce-associated membrane protein